MKGLEQNSGSLHVEHSVILHVFPYYISWKTAQYFLRTPSVHDHSFNLQWPFARSNSLVFKAVFDILPNPSKNPPPECHMRLA